MKIKIDYPQGLNISESYDGQTHNVEVESLWRAIINGKEIFILEYYDLSRGGVKAVTILERRGNDFVKVPLLEYNAIFFDLYDRVHEEGTRIKPNILPPRIGTRKVPVDIEYYLGTRNEDLIPKNPNKPVNPPKKGLVVIYRDFETGIFYADPYGNNELRGLPHDLKLPPDNIIRTNGNVDYLVKPIIKVRVNKNSQEPPKKIKQKVVDAEYESPLFTEFNKMMDDLYNSGKRLL